MKKPMKPSMKKPVKKADGGSIAGSPPAGSRPMPMPNPSAGGIGRGMGRPMPMPNPRAREVASPKARFNRPGPITTMPITGGSGMGGSPPVRRPSGNVSASPLPLVPVKKGGMPMRKAKGGMAKGKKK